MSHRVLPLAAAALLLAAWTPRPAPRAPAQAVKYIARMTGANETPATTSKATGTATLTLTGNQLHYVVDVHNLSGPATMAHIHVGATGVAGPPALTFTVHHVANGDVATGTFDLTKLTGGVSGDSLKTLLNNGNAYVNVHTAGNPGGEIRGQVMKQ